MKNKKNKKGFTLVELLVVIAIIGILAVVAVPALFKNIEKGKVADLESDISALRSAILSYYSDNSEYPVDTQDINNKEDDTPPVFTPNKTTGDESNIELDSTKHTGSIAIFSELEGLSFPFGGKYELTNEKGDVDSGKAVKSPKTLYLKVTTKDDKTTISQNGLDKLAKDLGLTSPVVIGNSSTTGSSTTIGVRPAAGGTGQIMIIPLVNK